MATQTINPLPQAASDFLEVLRTFLANEDAQRLQDIFDGYVAEGGIHAPAAGLTATPDPLIAFPAGFFTTETGPITYPDNATVWVVASADTVGDIAGYIRVAGTHYLISVVAAPITFELVRLMKVTTAAGAITQVEDQRQLSVLHVRTLSPYLRLEGSEAGGVDLRLREDQGTLDVQINTGTSDEPVWADRFSLVPATDKLTLVSGVTVPRTQTYPDKDGTFAMLSDISGSAFPPGTRMIFDNDTAPPGWVRDVSAAVNDVVLRSVSGARADGGSWSLTGANALAHQLTVAEMPAHTHTGPGATQLLAAGVVGAGLGEVAGIIQAHVPATDPTGGDGSHTHVVTGDGTWRPRHRDVIVAQKS